MIEDFFSHPDALDQIRRCWLSEQLEQYVQWLVEQGYGVGTIYKRVSVVRRFADFSKEHGAQSHDDLPSLVEPFVSSWMADRGKTSNTQRSRAHRNEIRGPVEQLLLLILPTFVRHGHPPKEASNPFLTDVP